jgi:hypothetical protein
MEAFMNETNSNKIEIPLTKEEWVTHFQLARNFLGSDAEYCKRNSLNPRAFKTNKVKLGFVKPRKIRTKGFIRMEPEEISSYHEKASRDRTRQLPDAKWVAEFILEITAHT